MMLAKSLQSAAGNAAGEANYIEDVFSTYLYNGGSPQPKTITNGIDLAGEGGLVWTKARNIAEGHRLVDTVRGATKALLSNETSAQVTEAAGLTSFLSDGYVVNYDAGYNGNLDTYTYASWTFRKAPKFFDVVTYTGNGSSPRDIAHSLGSAPGCIFLKRTDSTDNWFVFHRSIDVTSTSSGNVLCLNLTNDLVGPTNVFAYTVPTATTFKVGSNANINGATYVAYLFAHNAGGFGESGTDNVISCGSFTTDGSGNATVDLGYEPQYFLFKRTDSTSNWRVLDVMRGGSLTQSSPLIFNTTGVENSFGSFWSPTATGFNIINQGASSTWIYIAIRRGPMKVPTDGTSVFAPTTYTGTGSARSVTGLGFPPDMVMLDSKSFANNFTFDKLRGTNRYLFTNSTAAETFEASTFTSFDQNGFSLGTINPNESGVNYANWNFRRAPGFFDVVCYTGTGSLPGVAHNLGVTPELKLIKCRSATTGWFAGGSIISENAYLQPNTGAAAVTASNYWNGGDDSPTIFSVRNSSLAMDSSGQTYVAYLFASCPGVQSIQSYVGDGTTGRTINCGFTGGARFVCIKATSATGSWWTFDSARGITTNADPVLQLNSTDAEITSADAIDPAASGFIVNQEATCSLNASGVSYLVWAIA